MEKAMTIKDWDALLARVFRAVLTDSNDNWTKGFGKKYPTYFSLKYDFESNMTTGSVARIKNKNTDIGYLFDIMSWPLNLPSLVHDVVMTDCGVEIKVPGLVAKYDVVAYSLGQLPLYREVVRSYINSLPDVNYEYLPYDLSLVYPQGYLYYTSKFKTLGLKIVEDDVDTTEVSNAYDAVRYFFADLKHGNLDKSVLAGTRIKYLEYSSYSDDTEDIPSKMEYTPDTTASDKLDGYSTLLPLSLDCFPAGVFKILACDGTVTMALGERDVDPVYDRLAEVDDIVK